MTALLTVPQVAERLRIPTWDELERIHCAIWNACRCCETLPDKEASLRMMKRLEEIERAVISVEWLWTSVSRETTR